MFKEGSCFAKPLVHLEMIAGPLHEETFPAFPDFFPPLTILILIEYNIVYYMKKQEPIVVGNEHFNVYS